MQQLRCFVAVAEAGQITRAARALHVAQPALSRSVVQLESHLGVELLRRHARGVALTASGEAFLQQARAALAAVREAEVVAHAATGATAGSLVVGFIGPPPTIKALVPFAAFGDAYPDVDLSVRELPFPTGPTSSWVENVDVALCHPPAPHDGVRIEVLRSEPRVLVTPRAHRLGERSELSVADVFDETFLRYHPDVQPTWAAFHSLDDHRGGPPTRMTADCASTALEMLAMVASGRGVTTLPACDAELIPKVLQDVAVIPLRDASPFALAMVWREGGVSGHVDDFAALARSVVASPQAQSGLTAAPARA